jgi:hypothetical protein
VRYSYHCLAKWPWILVIGHWKEGVGSRVGSVGCGGGALWSNWVS